MTEPKQMALSEGPSAFDLLTEARWEMEGIRRAALRYQEAALAADPSTLPSGQKLLREVVPPLIGKIATLQSDATATLGTGGRPPVWAWPVQLLEPPALALITVVNAMNSVRDQGGPVSALTAVSLEIATATQDEVNYRSWVAAQAAENAQAKEAQDWEHRDLLAAFKRQYPAADRKTWTRWRRKIEALQREPWEKETANNMDSMCRFIEAIGVPAGKIEVDDGTQVVLTHPDPNKIVVIDAGGLGDFFDSGFDVSIRVRGE